MSEILDKFNTVICFMFFELLTVKKPKVQANFFHCSSLPETIEVVRNIPIQ